MNDYILVPYVGAIPITFAMVPADVEKEVGPPDDVGTNNLTEREERRGPLVIRYSKIDGKVVEIALLPAANIVFQGRNLFRTDNLVNFLSQYDRPFEFVGFVVFLALGITVTGVHDNDESQKAITVFRSGRWDEFRNELVPLS